MQNALVKKMARSPLYGASKVGLNGLTVHLQVAENDRVAAEEGEAAVSGPRTRYYVCAPGFLRTAFSDYAPQGKPPEAGAEVVVRWMADDERKFEGGSYWELEDG